jgi:ribosomal peptide maturation radical SAM protein 1
MSTADSPRRLDLLLVAMPWETVLMPSIRLGLLKAVCERAGFACAARHFNVDAMEHFFCASRAPGRSDDEAIGPDDYQAIAERTRSGLGDWIFAAPPLRDPAAFEPDPYLALMRGSADPEWQAQADLALRLRELAPPFVEAKAREVVACRPRVLGLTLSFGQTTASLALARRVKALDPSIRVIVGGAACEGPMGIALLRAFPQIDAVVRGEADRVLPDLLRNLVDGGPLVRRPGLCFRDGDAVVAEPPQVLRAADLDALPVPDFDDYFTRLAGSSFRAQINEQIALPFEASRGCWWGQKHHCTFCGLNGDGIAFRCKSAGRAVDEIATLAHRHRVLRIQVLDNIIATEHLRELLPRLRDRGADLSLFWETKSNLTRAQVVALRDAGARSIQPGIESLSTPILSLMRKGVTALQNIRLLKWCATLGVLPVWNFLYGFPGEPEDEYARMAALVPALGHLAPPSGLRRLCVDRFSPYFEDPGHFGIELLGPEVDYRTMLPVDAATAADLAYQFAFRHRDGRDPERYVTPLREAVDAWCTHWHPGRSLVYRRGPGFLSIIDRRPGMAGSVSDFGPLEAATYLACEDGADAATVARWFAAKDVAVSEGWVRGFLDELAIRNLVFVDGGKALALALPANPDAAMAAEAAA